MSRFAVYLVCAGLFLLGLTFPAHSAPPDFATLEIGDAAPDFELPGVDEKTYRLADFSDSKVLVVVFTCNHCPTAQAYEERIKQIHSDYKGEGVALVAISPNDAKAVRLDELGYTDVGDSLEDMKIRAKAQKFPFPYLYDGESQKASAAYGVLATPHVFVFDASRKLRYVGRIDDSDVGVVRSHDTRKAIDALLEGKPVAVERTRVFGCSTKWSDKRASARQSIDRWNAEPVSLDSIDEAGVKALVANQSEKYRLINVWATWCGPCVEELSELVTMNRMYRKRRFEMFTISVDGVPSREKALKVLKQKHVSSTNYVFTSEDLDKLAEALDKEWPGPVPYTILVAPGGKILYRKHGELDSLQLKQAIVERLGRTYASR